MQGQVLCNRLACVITVTRRGSLSQPLILPYNSGNRIRIVLKYIQIHESFRILQGCVGPDLNYMFHGTFIVNDFYLMGFQVGQYIGAFHVCIKGDNSCKTGIHIIRSRLHRHLCTCIFPIQILQVPQLVICIAVHTAVKDSVHPDIRFFIHIGWNLLIAAAHLSCQYRR